MLFDVRTEPHGAWVEVIVLGELDLASAPELRRELRRAIVAGPVVVVDLSAVALIDSVGLGLLVGAHRRARDAGGSLVVVAPSDRLVALLADTGLDHVLDVRASYEPSSTAG